MICQNVLHLVQYIFEPLKGEQQVVSKFQAKLQHDLPISWFNNVIHKDTKKLSIINILSIF